MQKYEPWTDNVQISKPPPGTAQNMGGLATYCVFDMQVSSLRELNRAWKRQTQFRTTLGLR